MQTLTFTEPDGTQLNVNPINIGTWKLVPQAAGSVQGVAIEVNGIVHIVRDPLKKVDKQIREALQPE